MVGTIPAVSINSIANIKEIEIYLFEIGCFFIFINKKLLSVPVKRHKLSLSAARILKKTNCENGWVLICLGAPVKRRHVSKGSFSLS